MLTLVRHAEAVRPTPDGPSQLERPLSARGARDAGALADDLVPDGYRRVVSSPYRRALDTVRPTADRLGLPIELCDDAREWDSGLAFVPDLHDVVRAAWADPAVPATPGESFDELTARAASVIDALVQATADLPVLLGSHGTWISRALLAHGVAVDLDFWSAMPLPAVYRFTRDADGLAIRGPGIG